MLREFPSNHDNYLEERALLLSKIENALLKLRDSHGLRENSDKFDLNLIRLSLSKLGSKDYQLSINELETLCGRGLINIKNLKTRKQLENIFSRMKKGEEVSDKSSIEADVEALKEFYKEAGSTYNYNCTSQALRCYLVGTWFEKGQGVFCDINTAKFFYDMSLRLGCSLAYQAMGRITLDEVDQLMMQKISMPDKVNGKLVDYGKIEEEELKEAIKMRDDEQNKRIIKILEKKALAALYYSMAATLFPLQTARYKQSFEDYFLYSQPFYAVNGLCTNIGLEVKNHYTTVTSEYKKALTPFYLALARIHSAVDYSKDHRDLKLKAVDFITSARSYGSYLNGNNAIKQLLEASHNFCQTISPEDLIGLPDEALAIIVDPHFVGDRRYGFGIKWHYPFLTKKFGCYVINDLVKSVPTTVAEVLPLPKVLVEIVFGYWHGKNNFFPRQISSSSSPAEQKDSPAPSTSSGPPQP